MLTIDLNKIPLQDGQNILDLGCGEGRHSIGAAWIYPNINVVGVDLSLKDLSTAKTKHVSFDQNGAQRTLYCQTNGCKLPFADNCFDHIICSEVLEHVEQYQEMIDEMHRVLKPSGTLSISVPRFWPEKICWQLSRAYHQVAGGHIRIFKSEKLRDEVQNKNFKFHQKHWAHALHVPYWWLRCAFWSKGENFLIVRIYHKLLVWDLLKRPWITRTIEQCLNPLMGKSIVMYFEKNH